MRQLRHIHGIVKEVWPVAATSGRILIIRARIGGFPLNNFSLGSDEAQSLAADTLARLSLGETAEKPATFARA